MPIKNPAKRRAQNRRSVRKYKLAHPVTETPEQKAKRAAYHRRRKYGLSVDEQRELLSKPCAICGEPSRVIDHDHVTGQVREALCIHCNVRLSVVEDKVWMAKALQYTNKHREKNNG